jgi:hypothetical protein
MNDQLQHEEPFIRRNLSEPVDTFTIRLNGEERATLEADKKLLRQIKDSTAMKQLAEIGHIVLHNSFFGHALLIVLENKRRNERLGIPQE